MLRNTAIFDLFLLLRCTGCGCLPDNGYPVQNFTEYLLFGQIISYFQFYTCSK